MGNWEGGWVGRVPMLHILLSGILASTGLEAYTATIIVSSTFYILTLFPLRSFQERYLSPIQAAWGCLLFILAPKVIRFSISGLLDPERYFFLIATLLFFFRLSDHARFKDAFFLGLSLAGLSVARGEGFPIAIVLFLFFPVFVLLQKKIAAKKMLRRYFPVLVISLFFWFLGIFPFCMANQYYNHAFVTDLRIAEIFTGAVSSSEVSSTVPAEVSQEQAPVLSASDNHMSFKRIMDPINSTFRGAYELYLIFAVLGMILLGLRRKWNWEYSLFLALYILHTVIYIKISSAYRYSIYLVPLFMPFTVAGLEFCYRLFRSLCKQKLTMNQTRLTESALYLGCFIILISQAINGLEIVVRRKDAINGKIAAFIREYAAENFPGQRLRLAADGHSITVYRSGAYSVWNYKSRPEAPDPRTFRDFDLLMLDKEEMKLVASCKDLVPVNTSQEFPGPFFYFPEKFSPPQTGEFFESQKEEHFHFSKNSPGETGTLLCLKKEFEHRENGRKEIRTSGLYT